MKAFCTQNTDRECRENDCCLTDAKLLASNIMKMNDCCKKTHLRAIEAVLLSIIHAEPDTVSEIINGLKYALEELIKAGI